MGPAVTDLEQVRLAELLATMSPELRAKYDAEAPSSGGYLMRMAIAERIKYEDLIASGQPARRITQAEVAPTLAAPSPNPKVWVVPCVTARLSDALMAAGETEGLRIWGRNVERGRTPRFRGGAEYHVFGQQCEIAAGVMLGIPWRSHFEQFDAPDLDPNIDVKGTHSHDGLRVLPDTNIEWRYVGVYAEPPMFYLTGWLPGRSTRDDRYPATRKDPTWRGWLIPETELWKFVAGEP